MSGKGFSIYYVFLGVIAFLFHRRLFKYFKTRHSGVQLAVLNNVVRARGRLNSLLYNVYFLKKCLENSVALERHPETREEIESLSFGGD